jgi:hypothetical protein
MKKGFNSVGQSLNVCRAIQRRRLFSFANYFTILFIIALLGDPSVLRAQTCSGNAAVLVSQTGVDFPNDALGAVNGNAAQLWDTGDQIVLDLNNMLNSGSTIVVTWKGNTSSSADPVITVETSSNGTTFTAVAGSPFTLPRTAAFYTNNITTAGLTSYVRFTTTNGFNVDLDALTFTNQTCSSICGTNTAGTVWRDYNSDGIKDATETQGLGGVTVKAYDCNGNLAETATTDANGQYTFTSLIPSATNKYRIEFSNIPPQYKPTFNGTNGRTDIQFISAASCAVNLGINAPSDYCQANPNLAVPCFLNGNPLGGGTSGAADWLVAFPYSITGTTPPPTKLNGTVLGAVWGQAYQRQSKKLFSAAYVKRHSGLGTYSTDGSAGAGPISGTDSGSGGIYVTNFSSGTPVVSNFVNLQALGIETGDFATARNLPSGKLTPNQDIAAFNKVSKAGLGDLDLSEDEQTLFVTNLFDRKIYQLAIGSTGTVPTAATALPNAPWLSGSPCNNGVARPFGLKVRDGKLYVGVVCTAENGGTFSDLNATVYAYDLTAGTWKTAINFPLNYPRGVAYAAVPASNKWNPWTDVMNSIPNFLASGALQVSYPTPILSDIEFDEKNNMILAFTDRTGDQIGSNNYGVYNTTDLYYYVSGGDILKAGNNGSGQWLLENNGTSGGNTTTGAGNNQGPGGGEFFPNENLLASHQETTVGSLAYLMGKNEVVLTVIDPIDYTTGGLAWFSSTTGAKNKVYELYYGVNTSDGVFGKANGLGDLELLCDAAPIQVGNYVWKDTDKDGVQDPCETPLSNITVSLWKGTTQIASTTTNANGEYYFSSKSKLGTPANWTGTGADTTLLPNMAYEIRIDTTNQAQLDSLKLTTADATAGGGNDLNDSDASVSGVYAVIAFTTGAAGSTNHTFDFGFAPCPTVGSIKATSASCTTSGVANANAKIKISTILNGVNYSYGTNGTTGLYYASATTLATDSIVLSNLVNPAVATTYSFRVYGGDSTCYKDISVILYPITCVSCSRRVLYICGLEKPLDAPAFDHGMITYLKAIGHTVQPAQVVADGLQDPNTGLILVNGAIPLTLNDFDKIVVSHSAKNELTANTGSIVTSLRNTSKPVLMMTRTGTDVMGMSNSIGFVNGIGSLWIENNTSSILTSGFPNDNISVLNNPTLVSPDGYMKSLNFANSVGTGAIVGTYFVDQPSADTRIAYYGYPAGATLADATAAAGRRFFIGFKIDGGSSYSPEIVVNDPTDFFTAYGKKLLDAALQNTCPCTCDTTLVVNKATICNGAGVNLYAQTSGVKGTLTYSTNGATWSALTNPTNVIPSVTTTYFVKDTLTGGCFDIDTLIVTVNPVPTGGTPTVTKATCTNGSTNTDGKIEITGITNGAKYTYGTNGTVGLLASNATTLSGGAITISNLGSPATATTYTFRIYGVDENCYKDITAVLDPSVCPPCSITATFTQSPCNSNNTSVITVDDYFTLTVSGVTATNGGTSGKYEVMLNGTTLNSGGTAYGTSVTVGGILYFKSDNVTTYDLTVRDLDMPTCTATFKTAPSASCSAVDCKPIICLPVTVTRN